MRRSNLTQILNSKLRCPEDHRHITKDNKNLDEASQKIYEKRNIRPLVGQHNDCGHVHIIPIKATDHITVKCT